MKIFSKSLLTDITFNLFSDKDRKVLAFVILARIAKN